MGYHDIPSPTQRIGMTGGSTFRYAQARLPSPLRAEGLQGLDRQEALRRAAMQFQQMLAVVERGDRQPSPCLPAFSCREQMLQSKRQPWARSDLLGERLE